MTPLDGEEIDAFLAQDILPWEMKGVFVAENIQISDKCDFDHCRNCQIFKNGFRRWQDKNAHDVHAALSMRDKKWVKAKFNGYAGENCILSKGKGVS